MPHSESPERARLVLHIGTQKTGTTTIQGFLRNSTDALAKAGVHYLNTGRTNIAHNVMIPMIRKGRGPGVARRLVREIGRHQDKTCVISSEMFFRDDLADFFAEHFPEDLRHETRVVVYLRRQDKYAEAMWKQRVKNGRYTGTPQDYLLQKAKLHYLPTLDRFAEVFGRVNIIAQPFERDHFPSGDVLQDFARHCHVPVELAESYSHPSSNATLSKDVTEELGRLNRENSGVNTRQIIRFLSKTRPEGAVRSGDCYALEERQAIMAEFAQENEILRQKYCPHLPTLFDLSDLEQSSGYVMPTPNESAARKAQARAAVELAISELTNQ